MWFYPLLCSVNINPHEDLQGPMPTQNAEPPIQFNSYVDHNTNISYNSQLLTGHITKHRSFGDILERSFGK